MTSVPPALSFLLVIVAGWVHRHQLIVIEFLQAENQAAQRPVARQAYPLHRCRACAAGEEGNGSGTQGPTGTGDDRFSGYSAALAPTIDRREMEFRAPARAWSARDH